MRLSLAIGLTLYLMNACVTKASAVPPISFKSGTQAEQFLRANRSCPGCDLRQAELSHADLRDADLRGANLKGADFKHADLRGANLRGAVLAGSDLSTSVLLADADLRDADLTEANVSPDQLSLARTCRSILPNGTISIQCSDKD
ncbi:MAG: pentapeptide repeat-containing protein [Proteobacteria bacterium]|nr:MAG: pentapeptide repeat-containing protein [Pseudomonadota bacterium]